MSAEAQATETMDLTALPVVGSVTREVYEPLTHDDYQSRSHELGALVRRINSEEAGLKAYSKVKRGEIENLEEERDDLIRLLDRGIGRDVECDVRLDESRKLRLIVRRDNGELLGEEPFKSGDYPPPLFAVVEGESAVPHSRTIREAFISTLEGSGGAVVQRLHAEGFLDPTDWEIEEAPTGFLPFSTSEMLRDGIADSESDLDESEMALVDEIGASEPSESEMLTIAINSRTADAEYDGECQGVWERLIEVRDARAAIDAARVMLAKLEAEACDPSDRTEMAGAVEMRNGRWEPVAVAETAEASVRVPVREIRTVPPGERTGRWDVPEYWAAHDAGLLDPDESDLRAARVAWNSTEDVSAINKDLDALEQDCAAEIKTSAKARMAITRGSWPTKVAKVDDAIAAVRTMRARLEVALDNEAERA